MNSPNLSNEMAIIKPLTLYSAITLNIIAPLCILCSIGLESGIVLVLIYEEAEQ